MTADSKLQTYKPSLIDRFTDWVESLPVRAWIFYLVSGILLILVQILFLWLDGGLDAQELDPHVLVAELHGPLGPERDAHTGSRG